MKTKAQLRTEIGATRQTLNPQWQQDASRRVVQNIERTATFQSAKTVALYKALADEVDLDSLFVTCWKLGKNTCIPIFNSAKNIYEMARVDAETIYSTGNYGIREPQAPSLLPTSAIDFFAVPGVAFDTQGNRLGRGGGYYDRLLDHSVGTFVAATFDFQLVPAVPHEDHDIPVHAIATETKIINVCNEY